MSDVLRHRGPDSEGFYFNQQVGLGMRRLKVIDLTTGSQPIFNEDKTLVVVLNGEIYNYLELRKLLRDNGHRFYTQSDTEVLVHLYEDYGENFLSFLNGMFAVALWDDKQKKLILARDRIGEKPLHYMITNQSISFSSEIKSFLIDKHFMRKLDSEALYHYFSFNAIPAPHTIFEGVKKLYPGHYLVYQFGNFKIVKYWDFEYDPQYHWTEEYISEQLQEILTRSVQQRVRSDVPFGAFLSGGIDSSVVVGLMSSILEEPVKTFSIGFEEDRYNELGYARLVAKKFSTDHHEVIVRPSAIDILDKLIWHFDEPFAGPSAIPTYFVSELARKYVTVVLTGDGGDEVFLGYDRYIRMLKRRKFSALPEKIKYFLARMIGDKLPHGAYGKIFLQALSLDDIHYFTVGLSENQKKSLFSADFLKTLDGLDSFKIIESHVLNDSVEYLSKFNYFDFKSYLPNDVLVKVDRMAMANSLETRCLFLDHEIIEFGAKIPVELKLKGLSTKYILKKSMRKFLPEPIMDRGKWGFALPVDVWFRNELRDLIIEEVEKVKHSGIFNYNYLSMILKEHLSGRRNHQRLLWAFLIFQLWYDNFHSNGKPVFDGQSSYDAEIVHEQ